MTGSEARLAAMLADLEGYIERRAQEIAGPKDELIEQLQETVENYRSQNMQLAQVDYERGARYVAENLTDASGIGWTVEAARRHNVNAIAACALMRDLQDHITRYGRPLSTEALRYVERTADVE